MSMKIRDGWRRMFARLQNSPYKGNLYVLGREFGVGKNIAFTLQRMGIIQETPEGWIIPKDRRQTAAMWERVRMLHPHNKEAQNRILESGIISPSRATVAEKQTSFMEELDRSAAGAEIPHGEIIAFAERLAGAGYNVEIAHPNGSFYIKIQR